MSYGVPAAEVRIDVDLVRSLLQQQHPDLAAEPLAVVGEGWDCVTVRVGERRAARLPRRASAAPLVEVEHRWLSHLGPSLPIPTPIPERRGAPTPDYPWEWSIVPWFEGASADRLPLDASAARPLAEFMVALHRPPHPEAPSNPWRGVPLGLRAGRCEEWLDNLEARPNGLPASLSRRVRSVWNTAVEAPVDVEPSWLHGDLHPRNVVSNGGRLAAVIDWGDVCQGDLATDLASLWMLLPSAEARREARDIVDARTPRSDATWARARGWAVFFGAVMLISGLDDRDDLFAECGRTTLDRVAGD